RRGPSRTPRNRSGTPRTRSRLHPHTCVDPGGNRIMITPGTSRRAALFTAGALSGIVALTGCGADDETRDTAAEQVTVTNCGEELTYPAETERLFVNGDGNMMASVLAIGAADQVVGVGGLADAADTLSAVYGADEVGGLPIVSDDYPTFENVVAKTPDVVFSGWGYGWEDKTNLTPAGLAEHDIAAYTLSESCRQGDGDERGAMPPWEALFTDLTNLGDITGQQQQAQDVTTDIEQRLDALESAPQPE